MKTRLIALVIGLAIFAIAQAPQLIPVWNGQAYTFPRLGPSLKVANSQLDAVLTVGPQGPPGAIGPQGQPGQPGAIGPQGSQGPAGGFPYLLPNGDVDLGTHTLTAGGIIARPGPFRLVIDAGSVPANTCDAIGCADAVVFLDAADNRLKMRKRNGDLVVIEMTPTP